MNGLYKAMRHSLGTKYQNFPMYLVIFKSTFEFSVLQIKLWRKTSPALVSFKVILNKYRTFYHTSLLHKLAAAAR